MVMNGKLIPDFDQEATGKRIGQIIEESGMKDKDLALLLGVSIQAVNKWRHAKTLPDIENLFFLSQLFDRRLDDFIVARKDREADESASGLSKKAS